MEEPKSIKIHQDPSMLSTYFVALYWGFGQALPWLRARSNYGTFLWAQIAERSKERDIEKPSIAKPKEEDPKATITMQGLFFGIWASSTIKWSPAQRGTTYQLCDSSSISWNAQWVWNAVPAQALMANLKRVTLQLGSLCARKPRTSRTSRTSENPASKMKTSNIFKTTIANDSCLECRKQPKHFFHVFLQ